MLRRTILIYPQPFQFEKQKYTFNIDHDNTRLYLNVFQKKDVPVTCPRFSPLFNRITDILENRHSSKIARVLTSRDQKISNELRREYKIEFDLGGIEDEIVLFETDNYRSYSDQETANRVFEYMKYHNDNVTRITYAGLTFVSKNKEGHIELKNHLLDISEEFRLKLKEANDVLSKMYFSIHD